MRRITVIALTALATLAVTAGAVLSVFHVVPAIGPAGSIMLLRGSEIEECRDGGGCGIMSEREFQNAVLQTLLKLQRSGVLRS